MATYNEMASMILDLIHEISDDATFTKEHVIFLMSKYRAMILAQNYNSQKKQSPISNYQTICIKLQRSEGNDLCGTKPMLVSTSKVPKTMAFSMDSAFPPIGFPYGRFNIVTPMKFKYAGSRFSKNEIFVTIAPNGYLYMKSDNENFLNLDRVLYSGIFEDVQSSLNESCTEDGTSCENKLDNVFPIEEAFQGMVIDMVVQTLSRTFNLPKDDENNAHDDLNAIIRQYANRTDEQQAQPKQQ